MADEYDECLTCGAMVDRMSKHRKWHTELDDRLSRIERVVREVRDL